MPQPPTTPRDFEAELSAHDKAIDAANAARLAFLHEWTQDLKDRIARLRHPETGERLSILAMQPLLGIPASSRRLYAALNQVQSVPLIIQCDTKVCEMERAGLFWEEGDE